MLDAIIFDYDGVIGDTQRRQYDWFKFWADFKNKPFPWDRNSFEVLYNQWQSELGPEKTYHKFGLPADMSNDKTEVWHEYRKFKKSYSVDTFKGMKSAMKDIWNSSRIQLSNDDDRVVRLAINTTNDAETIKPTLESFGMLNYFDHIIATEKLQAFAGPFVDISNIKKPSKISIALALMSLDAKGSKTIHVGDTIGDLKSSYDVFKYHPEDKEDLITIGVAWGYDGRSILEAGTEFSGRAERIHFDHIVDTPAELATIVKEYIK